MPRRLHYGPGTPCWVDCITPDLTGSRAFYRAVMGWEFVTESPDYQLAELAGEIIGGFGAAPANLPPRAAWNVYLATKDAEHTCALVRGLGGQVVMSPVPASGNGRLFLAVDPSGVAVGFWEGHQAEGVVLVDEAGAVCGHELRVPDARRAAAFYGDLFGYRLTADGEWLDLEGAVRTRVVESDQGRSLWLPYFGASDVRRTVESALVHGAQLVRSGRGEPTVLRDPWGAEFGLVGC
ncbi:VOC family protein [Kitasatospora sp. LaBMicrA B282]|uniref:VOC family protein n=1 Tax=Kitasatospora sp. LaBMicrA B282 TaxID=3420949 RepID=UPI003D0E5301